MNYPPDRLTPGDPKSEAYRAGLELRRRLGFTEEQGEQYEPPFLQQGTIKRTRQTTRVVQLIGGLENVISDQTLDIEEITLTEVTPFGRMTYHVERIA